MKCYTLQLTSLLFVFFCECALSLNAQNRKIDSLKVLLADRSLSNNNRVDILYKLGLASLYVDYQLSLRCTKESLELIKTDFDSLKFIKFRILEAAIFLNLEQLDSSIFIYNGLLSFAGIKKYKEQYKIILNGLGMVYVMQGYYDKALHYHFESLELREKDNDKTATSIALNNIGFVYYNLNNYDKALSYFERSLLLRKQAKSNYDLDRLLINIGLCYANKRKLLKAKEYIDSAFSTCPKECSNEIIVEGEYAYGFIYYDLGNLKEAEKHFLKSCTMALEINNERFQIENIIKLSKIYIDFGKYVSAKKYLMRAQKIKSIAGYNFLQMEIYKQFSSLYNHRHDYKNASIYEGKYIQLRDSIYSQELTQNLMAVQAEYEQRENKAQIDSQRQMLFLKEKVISRQNWITTLACITVVLMILLVLLLYKSNRQKKRVNQLLEQKVKERTLELEQSYTALQQTHHEQIQFISKISNDIKNPLNTMKGLCLLALKELPDTKAQEYMVQMNTSTKYMSDLINRLSFV